MAPPRTTKPLGWNIGCLGDEFWDGELLRVLWLVCIIDCLWLLPHFMLVLFARADLCVATAPVNEALTDFWGGRSKRKGLTITCKGRTRRCGRSCPLVGASVPTSPFNLRHILFVFNCHFKAAVLNFNHFKSEEGWPALHVKPCEGECTSTV